ncbi:hypothetical protein HKX48_005759 [Thoreauomyces humboldtii]|nr:hypothetical protein HKX48_005759 [Thoreauomyces humboldtii]
MDDILASILGGGTTSKQSTSRAASASPPPKPSGRRTNDNHRDSHRRTRRGAQLDSESEDGQAGSSDDDDDQLSDGEEWADVKTWDLQTLMGDDADRQRLMGMSELAREGVLAERRTRVEKMQERLEVKRMLRRRPSGQPKNKRATEVDEDERPAKRQTTEQARRLKSISNLRKEREKKTKAIMEEDGDDDARSVDSEPRRSRNEHEAKAKASKRQEEEDARDALRALPTYTEVLKLQITRAELLGWVFAPFFDATAKGCFVRYGVGADAKDPSKNVYRLCYIEHVNETARPYQVEGKTIPKTATMSHASAERDNTFAKVSNSPISQNEYQRWIDTMLYEKIKWEGSVHEKQEELYKARNHTFTNEEVAAMVAKKTALQRIPVNLTTALPELQRKIMYAEEKGDAEKQAQLQQQLDRLLSLMPKPRKGGPSNTNQRVAGASAADASRAALAPGRSGKLDSHLKPVSMKDVSNAWDDKFAFDPALDEVDAVVFAEV